MIKDGKNREQVEHEKRLLSKLYERRQWAEYQRTYERCKAIAEAVWTADLDKAAAQQQTLAEQMRDRLLGTPVQEVYDVMGRLDSLELSSEIPVPLFTPRDRLQFLKEVSTSLMIGTERRGLTVTPEVKDVEAPQANEPGPGIPEAASGADETFALVPDAQEYGEPVSKTPPPCV